MRRRKAIFSFVTSVVVVGALSVAPAYSERPIKGALKPPFHSGSQCSRVFVYTPVTDARNEQCEASAEARAGSLVSVRAADAWVGVPFFFTLTLGHANTVRIATAKLRLPRSGLLELTAKVAELDAEPTAPRVCLVVRGPDADPQHNRCERGARMTGIILAPGNVYIDVFLGSSGAPSVSKGRLVRINYFMY